MLHRRIGEVMEARDGARPDEPARHFASAGPRESVRAVAYAERAAEEATRRLAYDEAVLFMRQALALAPSTPAELARLQYGLAMAEAAASHWEFARASFARSADMARTAGDAGLFAAAALGHSGGTWEQFGREDPESAELLGEALSRLADADAPLRVKVLARLAINLYYSDASEEEVIGPAFSALAMARRLGDPEPLLAALTAALYARWGPGLAHERLGLADELMAVVDEDADPVAAAEAHVWRALALLELCRLDEADVHLARHAELAERTHSPHLLVHADGLRAMRALLEGDYEGGEAAAASVRARVEHEQAQGRTPAPSHLGFASTPMVTVLDERGELGTVIPMLEEMAKTHGRLASWRAVWAWANVQGGDRSAARAEIAALSADECAVFRRDATFLESLTPLVAAVDELRDGALAAPLEPVLAPYENSWVVVGIGATTQGPVAYSLGLTQLHQGRAEEAIASFEKAIALSMAMRARPYVARSQFGIAQALRLRGEDARAAELEAQALATARELGMLRLQRELTRR